MYRATPWFFSYFGHCLPYLSSMRTVSEIKVATKQLKPKERVALFRWLSTQDDILSAQKKDLLADLDRGIA